MAFAKKESKVKLDEIKAITSVTANKVYGERPKQPLNKKIPLYLTEEMHEKIMHYTMNEKLKGGELNNASALIRTLLDEFFKDKLS